MTISEMAELMAQEETGTAQRTMLYTTAPSDYDGFGARTERMVGTYGTDKQYRVVSIPSEHALWFSQRCGSGLHNVHTEAEWQELSKETFFQKKFTPINQAEDTPMNAPVAEQEVVVMTVLPSAPVDLQALAQHINGNSVDIPRQSLPVGGVPETPESTPVPAPAPTTSKGKQVQELRAKAQELHSEAQKVLGQADLMPLAASALRDVARKMEKEAKGYELQAQALLEPAVKVVNPRGAEYVALLQAVYTGGREAVKALEAAIDAGMFGKKARTAKAESGEAAGSTPARQPAADDSERAALRAKVRELVTQGFRDGAIAKQLGIPDSTVYSIRTRMPKVA